MKSKKLFTVGFLSIVVFILIATYLWYLYFNNYEKEVLVKNVRLELINNGNIDYINAIINDDPDVIPIYYFRVKNSANEEIKYEIYIEDVDPSLANDGCTSETFFKRNELRFELKRDNRVIKSGLLSEVNNSILDSTIISGNSKNDYSLRIWLDENAENINKKHYHYTVNLREIK